ncbi:MAG: cupin domain-containing protein [Ignavibacteriae bacterium]|nr:cupin domain-containing protein [Ignavibacteriota bacterium]
MKKVKNINSFVKEKINVGEKTYKQVLISSEEAPNFAMRKFTIEPNGFMPLHNNTVEHEQYILNGSAEVQIGDEILQVKKDDIVFIPAEVFHSYKNIGNDNFEFLCLVPNQEDKITLKK